MLRMGVVALVLCASTAQGQEVDPITEMTCKPVLEGRLPDLEQGQVNAFILGFDLAAVGKVIEAGRATSDVDASKWIFTQFKTFCVIDRTATIEEIAGKVIETLN